MVVKDDTRREARRLETVKSIYAQCERGEIEEKDITQKIQVALGIGDRYVRMYKAIYVSGIQELQEAVKCVTSRAEQRKELDKGKESVRVHIETYPASKLALYPEDEQEEMLRRIYKGENVKDILKQAQKIRDSKKS